LSRTSNKPAFGNDDDRPIVDLSLSLNVPDQTRVCSPFGARVTRSLISARGRNDVPGMSVAQASESLITFLSKVLVEPWFSVDKVDCPRIKISRRFGINCEIPSQNKSANAKALI